MAPRGLRRLFRREKSPAPVRAVENAALPTRLQTSALDSKQIPSKEPVPTGLGDESSSSGAPPNLWEQVYDSFVSSTESPDLKSVAAILNAEGKNPAIGSSRPANLAPGTSASSEWRLCNEVLELADRERSKLDGDGAASKVRRAYEEITTWVEKFMFIGDAVASLDPVHVGLPWAGVRAILTISIQYQKSRADLVDGIARLSKLICRYAVFEHVYLNKTAPMEDSVKDKLHSSLKALYLSIFRYLVQAVLQLKSSVAARIGRSITLSDTTSKILAEIQSNEDEVLAYERMSIKAASHAQYMDVRLKLCTYQDHYESEKRKNVCDWISKIDCHSQHREMKSRVSPNTGRWFLERPEYGAWSETPDSSFLWLRGNAGTGKTSLVSCVIESFLERPHLDSTEAFAYFYCSRTIGDSRQQDPKSILLSLLRHLSSPQPGLPLKPPIVDEFEKETARGSQGANLTIDEVTVLLDRLIRGHYEKVTIVVDALDECDVNKRSKLLDVFTKLTYNSSSTVVKTLVSSRDDPDIRNHFASTPNLSITATDNAEDIARFVQRELQQRLLNRKASVKLRTRVEEYLTQRANGIFRWVALQVDALCDSERVFTEDDVDCLLTQLPTTLEGTYKKILQNVNDLLPHGRDCVENTLKMLMATEITLTIETLLEALNILSPPGRSPWDKRSVLKMAKGFVTYTGYEIIFAHLSVKEFLETAPGFHGEAPHALAAEACLKKYIGHYEPEAISDGMQRYALCNIAWHMEKAGNLRQSSKLHYLIMQFFQSDNSKAFSLWQRDRGQVNSFYTVEAYLWEPHLLCLAFPALPLFMVCVYKLNDLLDPMIHDYRHRLGDRNQRSRSLIETAAMCGNLEALKRIHEAVLVTCPSSIDTNDWVADAAKTKNLDVWRYTLDHATDLDVQRAILNAAANDQHGQLMISGLLDTAVTLSEKIVCGVLGDCASLETVKLVRAHAAPNTVTESMVAAAARNRHLNPALTTLLLSEAKALHVSERCFLSALDRRWYHEPHELPSTKAALVELFLSHANRCTVTEEILCLAIDTCTQHEDSRHIDLLLEAWPGKEITEDILDRAVWNSWIPQEFLQTILNYDPEPKLTPRIAEKALGVYRDDGLKFPGCPSLLEENIYHAVDISSFRGSIDSIVRGEIKSYMITHDFLRLFAKFTDEADLGRIVRMSRAFPVTWAVLCVANTDHEQSASQMEMLLDNLAKAECYINEDRIVMLLQPGRYLAGPLRVLASRFGRLPVTTATVSAAARCGFATFEYLLSQHDGSTEHLLTDDLLCIALESGGVEIVEYIKTQRSTFNVTEDMLRASCRRCLPALKWLLSQPGRCLMDEAMLEEVAEFAETALIDYVLAQPDAARFPETLSKLRRERGKAKRSQTVSDAEAIFNAAGSIYIENSSWLVDDLDSHEGPELDVSRLVELLAKIEKGKFCIQYLLRRFPGTPVTLEAVRAAAKNVRAPCSLFEYLLKVWGGLVDTDLLCLAAGNEYCGTQMVELLLSWPSISPEIDREAVMIASLSNVHCARSLFDFFLQREPALSVTQDMIRAASENTVLNSGILQKLLKHALRLSALDRVEAILEAIRSLPDGMRDSLFMAACYGEDDVLDLLLSRGVSVSSVSGELGTALDVAVYARNHSTVRKLLEHGCDAECDSEAYDKPMISACHNEDIQMIQVLVDHGASIDAVESGYMDRTSLHIALARGHQGVYQRAMALGASTSKVDCRGMAALHHAVLCDESALGLEQVLEAGVMVDAQDSHGWTALHWAAKVGATYYVSTLLAAGAQKDQLDALGRSPYDIAEFCGHFHLRTQLVLSDRVDLTAGVVGDDQETHCRACGMNIRGPLHKCRGCKNYKLCFRCIIDAPVMHDVGHEFDEIAG